MGRLVGRGHRRDCCGWPVAIPSTGEGSGDRGAALVRTVRVSWRKTGARRAGPARRKPIRARFQRPARWHVAPP